VREEIIVRTAGNVILLIAFVIVLLVAILVAVNIQVDRYPSQQKIVIYEFAFTWVVRVGGAFIAGLAALLMLGRAINDAPLIKVFALILPFFAGLLLIEIHWSVALSLGAIGLAFVVKTVVQALRGQEDGDNS
jgi:hypothetical protein